MDRHITTVDAVQNDAANWYRKVYTHVSCSEYYPEFTSWYQSRIVGHVGRDRTLICATIDKAHDNRIILLKNSLPDEDGLVVGVSLLKNTPSERKICTLRVNGAYRGKGIGSCLVKRAFVELQTDKPLMTVPEDTLGQFGQLLRRFGFKLNEESIGLYRNSIAEYCFNLEFQPSVSTMLVSNARTEDLVFV